MMGRNKNKKTYLSGFYFSNAVIGMHAGKIELCKSGFPYLMKFIFRHFFVSGIINCMNRFSIDVIRSYLTEKDIVSANRSLCAVLCNGISNELRSDGSDDKYFFLFVFAHDCNFSSFVFFELIRFSLMPILLQMAAAMQPHRLNLKPDFLLQFVWKQPVQNSDLSV